MKLDEFKLAVQLLRDEAEYQQKLNELVIDGVPQSTFSVAECEETLLVNRRFQRAFAEWVDPVKVLLINLGEINADTSEH